MKMEDLGEKKGGACGDRHERSAPLILSRSLTPDGVIQIGSALEPRPGLQLHRQMGDF